MQKLVFVNRFFSPDLSATSQMLTDLAQGLTARGYEVSVICSRALYDDPERVLNRRDTLRGVRVRRLATTRFGRRRLFGRALDYATFYLACAVQLVRVLGPGTCLIVKTDPPLLSVLAAPLCRLTGATLLTWQQDVFPEVASQLGVNPLPDWLDAGLRRLRDASLRSARTNVVIGRRMRSYFVQRGIPADRLAVIENWADDAGIRPKAVEASELRGLLGLGGKFVVSYSGNLGRAHEFGTLLGAMDALRDTPDIVFLIVGGGAKLQALQAAAAARALPNIRFLPYQDRDRLGDSLAAADVHLVSLLPVLEGLIVPSKLYGILAAGRPAIYIGDTESDGARLLLAAGCGAAVRVDAVQELVTLLCDWRSRPDHVEAMGECARRLSEQHFSAERALDQWVAVLGPTPAGRVSAAPPPALSGR